MSVTAPLSSPPRRLFAQGEMADRVRAHDWSGTELGPLADWPDRLLAAVETMLASPQLTTLAVGPAYLFLYNDAAAPYYGIRHPDVFGLPLAQAFPHEFDRVRPVYDRAWAGEGVTVPAQSLDPGQSGTAEVFTASLTPVRGADGVVIAVQMTGSAIGPMLRSQAALRASEERLRQFGEASRDNLWIRDADTLQWVYLTPSFEHIYGVARDEALRGDNFRNWRDLILPEDRPHALAAVDRVLAGEHVTFEYRIRRPGDGAIRWLRDTDFPIVDDNGKVALIGGIGHDFTEARETDLRFRTLLEGIPQLVWRAVDDGEWTWASPQWTACTGQMETDYRGRGWLDALHPDDRVAACQAWSHALEQGGFEVEYRLRRQHDGAYRWFQTRATAVRDAHGSIVEWLGTSTDIDERRALEELQGTLLAELQHRVRNILAVTHAIIVRSNDGEQSTQDYVNHLTGRISALARTQVLLTRAAGAQIDLEDMIRDELLAQIAADDQFALAGPEVKLSPKAAEVLTLAIHELATNATKYGAFAHRRGRLAISWSVDMRDGEPWLALDWVESGVPIVDALPRRQGFGTELISRRIPYELQGTGCFRLQPGGLHSHVEFPLRQGDSILRTDGVKR